MESHVALKIHFGDKLLPGLYNTVGVATEAQPQVQVQIAGRTLPFVLTRLDTELWKVRFQLPKDASGEVELSAKVGADFAKEKKAVG